METVKNEMVTLNSLISSGSLNELDASKIVEVLLSKKDNVVIYGGVGTGKTTLLEALIRKSIAEEQKNHIVYIPVVSELKFNLNERVRVIETYKHDKIMAINSAIKMNPDLIFVEEIRTPEEMSLIADAILEGHQVVITVHAQSKASLLDRLIMMLGKENAQEKRFSEWAAELMFIKTERHFDATRTITLE